MCAEIWELTFFATAKLFFLKGWRLNANKQNITLGQNTLWKLEIITSIFSIYLDFWTFQCCEIIKIVFGLHQSKAILRKSKHSQKHSLIFLYFHKYWRQHEKLPLKIRSVHAVFLPFESLQIFVLHFVSVRPQTRRAQTDLKSESCMLSKPRSNCLNLAVNQKPSTFCLCTVKTEAEKLIVYSSPKCFQKHHVVAFLAVLPCLGKNTAPILGFHWLYEPTIFVSLYWRNSPLVFKGHLKSSIKAY